MPLEPQRTMRSVFYPEGGTKPPGFTAYEILEEMFEMWFQAWDAWDAIRQVGGRYSIHGEVVYTVAEAKREVWEQAIMVYCGWNGTDLNYWLGEKMMGRGRVYVQ